MRNLVIVLSLLFILVAAFKFFTEPKDPCMNYKGTDNEAICRLLVLICTDQPELRDNPDCKDILDGK